MFVSDWSGTDASPDIRISNFERSVGTDELSRELERVRGK